MLLSYLLHENHLSEAIKRTIGIVEDIEHHVSLAAVEAVRGKLLLLPYRAHLSLHILILRKVSQLLELVYADDNPDALSFASNSGSWRIVILSRSCGTNFRSKAMKSVTWSLTTTCGITPVRNFFASSIHRSI